MKSNYLYITLIFVNLAFISKKQAKNFIKVQGNIFIQQHEVSNLEYEKFLINTKGFNNPISKIYAEEWLNLKPQKSYYKGFKDFYLIQNKQHPVVNVSQEGAKAYCRWRTRNYHLNPENQFNKVLFRLPTKEEWLQVYTLYKRELDEFDQFYEFKMAEPDSTMIANGWEVPSIIPQDFFLPTSEYAEMIEYINSNYKHKFLLCPTNFPETKENLPFHMNSNVSEWLNEENQIIGSNWFDRISEETSNSNLSSEASFPSPKIGFRMIMEIIEE